MILTDYLREPPNKKMIKRDIFSLSVTHLPSLKRGALTENKNWLKSISRLSKHFWSTEFLDILRLFSRKKLFWIFWTFKAVQAPLPPRDNVRLFTVFVGGSTYQ